MDPGALVADVDHLEQERVQTGTGEHFAENRLVGTRRASRHHDPVEPVLADGVFNGPLRNIGAGKPLVGGVGDVRQVGRFGSELMDIDHAGNIRPAVADEHADPGRTREVERFGVAPRVGRIAVIEHMDRRRHGRGRTLRNAFRNDGR